MSEAPTTRAERVGMAVAYVAVVGFLALLVLAAGFVSHLAWKLFVFGWGEA